jgi:hypothetical protein
MKSPNGDATVMQRMLQGAFSIPPHCECSGEMFPNSGAAALFQVCFRR